MWLVVTLLDSATLKHPRVSFREVVNPLKLVANVCFRVHCTFLWGGVYLYKIFKSISDPPRFNRKWQISQSWILWYLKVGITGLGGGGTLPMDFQHSGWLWFWIFYPSEYGSGNVVAKWMRGATQGLLKGRENHHGSEGTWLAICRRVFFLDLYFMISFQVTKEMEILLYSPDSKANVRKIK